MTAFYEKELIDNIDKSTNDEILNLNIISTNLNHLFHIKKDRIENRPIQIFNNFEHAEIINSTTVKKISKRKNERPQVQISKVRQDGLEFKRLREGLFTEDQIVFLNYRDRPNSYLTVGIPSTYEANTFLNEGNEEFNKNFNEVSPDSFEITLRRVTPENIAKFNAKSIDADLVNDIFDLSSGIDLRKKRTERHHGMVKQIALYLDTLGFSLFEGNIDCLASKENRDTLIIEAKTLDGSASDEAIQVRTAIGQLFYYEFLAMETFKGTDSRKIAFFESKISDEHIELFITNNCLVLWLNTNGDIVGTSDALNFINTLNV